MNGKEKLKVLLLDDDPEDVEQLERMLSDDFSFDVINHLASVTDQLRQGYDVLILDLGLPDSQGYDTFEAVEKMSGVVPVIVLTSNSDRKLAKKAMSHGAQDYLFKETVNAEVINRSIRYAIERNKLLQEQELIMAELKRSNAELQQFVYVASHDLQEPLRMVTSYLSLMERTFKHQLDPKAIEYIDHAMEGGNRMRELINDVLAYSRVDSQGKKFVPVDMGEVVAKVLAILRVMIEDTKAEVNIDPLPTISAYESQMIQVIQNLIANALKFHGQDRPMIQISSSMGEKEWTFSIKDNGIGFEMKDAEKIFLMFQRLHSREEYAGTGIGLALTKKIVERHGGRIWVESMPGKGATFFFSIPATEPTNGKQNHTS
jgi:light-regulated signal transduction histidine kinase (bacteriophytochrome)